MHVTKFHLNTHKETPADAEVVSHQLMLRAGMIRKLTSGIYIWTPLGLRVLRRVENVVREEMNAAGAIELSMPCVQPSELWQETGRWADFGPLLLKISDRAGREFCFGPTHEEVITDFARQEIRSYKQCPVNFYQIQTKFRDEIRPRFGVMRAREFLMKDAYSFDVDETGLQASYDNMFHAYTRIFTRLGLKFRAVEADPGAIGGSASHEFHVLAESGEDAIAASDASEYAANVEQAEALAVDVAADSSPLQPMDAFDTPDVQTIDDLCRGHQVPIKQTIKTLIVAGAEEGELLALVLRGDHELNEIKAAKLPEVAAPVRFATDDEIRAAMGADPGSLGPVRCPIPLVVDRSAAVMKNFVCGANRNAIHLHGANWVRDVGPFKTADLRKVQAGDPSPDGQGTLHIMRGIEVGHVFQLGTKYSAEMGATVLGEDGRATVLHMGCYGIGVSRIVAAAIEQNHDSRGIIWPAAMAPFQVALLPMNAHKSQRVKEAAEQLYQKLLEAGIEVLYDDRRVRPGVMFADSELIGIRHRLVVGERMLDEGRVEYRQRSAEDSEAWALNGAVEKLQEIMQAESLNDQA